jgi:hypothetical protein
MTMYYYSDGTPTPKGPVSVERLRAMRVLNTLTGNSPVIEVGASEWKTYDQIFSEEAASPSPVAASGFSLAPTPVRPAAPARVPLPPPVAATQPKPQKTYFYADSNNQPIGPVTRDEILALKSRGVVNGQTQVIAEGDSVWTPLSAAISPVDTAQISAKLGEKNAQVKGFLRNPAWYVGGYLIAMLPTYILPYFGSNSSAARVACAIGNAAGARSSCGTALNVLLALHIAFLAIVAYLAFARGSIIGKKWVMVFPVLAAFFDLTPGFSSIPLFPTVLHVAGIIVGATGSPVGFAPPAART